MTLAPSERTESLDLLYAVLAVAMGIQIKIAHVIHQVDTGESLTCTEIDELLSRTDRLRQEVEGCKVLYSDTIRSRT